jgi:hypothetical protein
MPHNIGNGTDDDIRKGIDQRLRQGSGINGSSNTIDYFQHHLNNLVPIVKKMQPHEYIIDKETDVFVKHKARKYSGIEGKQVQYDLEADEDKFANEIKEELPITIMKVRSAGVSEGVARNIAHEAYYVVCDQEEKWFMKGQKVSRRLVHHPERNYIENNYTKIPDVPLYKFVPNIKITPELKDWLNNVNWLDLLRMGISEGTPVDWELLNPTIAAAIPSIPPRADSNSEESVNATYQKAIRRVGFHFRLTPGKTGKSKTISHLPFSPVAVQLSQTKSEKFFFGGINNQGVYIKGYAEGIIPVMCLEEVLASTGKGKPQEHMIDSVLSAMMNLYESGCIQRAVSSAKTAYSAKDIFAHGNLETGTDTPLASTFDTFLEALVTKSASGRLSGIDAVGRRMSTCILAKKTRTIEAMGASYFLPKKKDFDVLLSCPVLGAEQKIEQTATINNIAESLIISNYKQICRIYAHCEKWVTSEFQDRALQEISQTLSNENQRQFFEGMAMDSSHQRRRWLTPRLMIAALLPEIGKLGAEQEVHKFFTRDRLDEVHAQYGFDLINLNSARRLLGESVKKAKPDKLRLGF